MHLCEITREGSRIDLHLESFRPLPPHTTAQSTSYSKPSTCDMSDESSLPYFRALFEVALQDYENQTSITLAKHPLAEQLQTCDSVENIIALFPQDLSEFRGDDKLTKLLKSVVSILCAISITAKLGRFIGLVYQKDQS